MTAQQLSLLLTNPNIKAFLEMIRSAEGTNYPNGYKYLFGSSPKRELLFSSYIMHPQKYVAYTDKSGKKIKTSAAGAYQITYTTWKVLKARLSLVDFGPRSQDIAALELIRETGAIPLIEKGKFKEALNKVRRIWASLPASGNNQPEKSLAQVTAWYQKAGGSIA